MPEKSHLQTSRIAGRALCLTAMALAGCAVSLPPAPAANPADARAPEAESTPWRPTLVATSHTFLSPQADDREQKKKQIEMKKEEPALDPAPVSSAAYYTCPMHPEIHESKPGQCPKCGMTLVKKTATEETKP
ncbi:MAG TPA: heavy metal-binding domain-containing protein [Chthoniobacterales bacterium]